MAHASVLPTGFRFLPTDCEIMYLLRILLLGDDDDDRSKEEISMSLNVIQRTDVYSIQPWELFNKFDNHQVHIQGEGSGQDSYLYFLTNLKKKTKNGTRIGRTVVVNAAADDDQLLVGTWKLQTGQTDIIDYKTGMSLGVKRAFTFQLAPTKKTDKVDNDDQDSNSCSSSSKKRKKEPDEEMEGVSYIMHEYTLYPSDDQGYSLCRIRRKIDKKTMINKKMRRSSSPTTSTTTTTTYSRESVQADQQDQIRAAGLYDYHHQQVMNNGVSEINIHPLEENNNFDYDGQQMAGYDLDNQYHYQEVMYNNERSCDNFLQSYEQEQQQQPVVVPAEEQTTTSVSSEIIHHHEENNIDLQQQQEAVVPAQGDVQISDLANKNEDFALFFNEDFLALIEQDVAATTTGKGLLY